MFFLIFYHIDSKLQIVCFSFPQKCERQKQKSGATFRHSAVIVDEGVLPSLTFNF
jgi:hypothetical protein